MRLFYTLIVYFYIHHSFASAQQTFIDSLTKKAGVESGAKNFLSALNIYTQLTEKEPDNSKWWFYRGQMCMMVNDFKHAEPDYNKAIQLKPNYFDAYVSRAILYFNQGNAEKSINDYNQALRYCTDESIKSFIRNNRGNAKMLRNDNVGAYDDFIKAYELDQQSPTTLSNLGNVLNILNRGEEALGFYEKVVAKDSNNLEAMNNVAYTLLNLNRFDAAKLRFDKVLLVQPNQPMALSNRALCFFNLHDDKNALNDIDQAIRLYPDYAYAYRNRGIIYVSQARFAEGCPDFQTALKLGFTKLFDTEVEELFKKYCDEK